MIILNDELDTCRTHERESRYAFIIFVRKPEGTRHFRDLTVTERIIM
jgi:hypothetical protein